MNKINRHKKRIVKKYLPFDECLTDLLNENKINLKSDVKIDTI